MVQENFSGRAPLVVGVLPEQHTQVLRVARDMALQMDAPVVFAYVDEASYLVEWDPSKETHRLSLHPEKEENSISAVRSELRELITAEFGSQAVDWTLRMLAGDPARALGRLAAEVHATMIIVGTPARSLVHRISEALNGSVASWLSHHQNRPVLIVPSPKQGSHVADSQEVAAESHEPGADDIGSAASGGPVSAGDGGQSGKPTTAADPAE